jgi:hypothetical protein
VCRALCAPGSGCPTRSLAGARLRILLSRAHAGPFIGGPALLGCGWGWREQTGACLWALQNGGLWQPSVVCAVSPPAARPPPAIQRVGRGTRRRWGSEGCGRGCESQTAGYGLPRREGRRADAGYCPRPWRGAGRFPGSAASGQGEERVGGWRVDALRRAARLRRTRGRPSRCRWRSLAYASFRRLRSCRRRLSRGQRAPERPCWRASWRARRRRRWRVRRRR